MKDLFRCRLLERVRHRTCGGRVKFRWDKRFECKCGQTWGEDTIARFSAQDMADRFEELPLTIETGEKMVWKTDGKKRFLAVVPAWDAGEPSGLA